MVIICEVYYCIATPDIMWAYYRCLCMICINILIVTYMVGEESATRRRIQVRLLVDGINMPFNDDSDSPFNRINDEQD